MSDPTSTTQSVGVPTQPGPPGVETAPAPGQPAGRERSASLWADAWRDLRKDPVFLISCLVILTVSSMAAFPRLWTSQDPLACNIKFARWSPRSGHPFGFSDLGCDYYAQAVYGARPSLLIAIFAAIGVVVIGGLLGILAGFFGGWTDGIISRVTDIFFSLPFLLGSLVFLSLFKATAFWAQVFSIAGVLAALTWVVIARITRGSVLAARNLDYVAAARALGASNTRLMFRHILPNAIAPTIVVATILLGTFVSAEATLTFLGVGLQPPAVSWGVMISGHQQYVASHPWLLLFPGGLLVATVLSFILAGDALRDALDPKLR